MSAEDFLNDANGFFYLGDFVFHKESVIKAMKEFAKQEAENAFDAGYNRAMFVEEFIPKDHPDKKAYINNLFK